MLHCFDRFLFHRYLEPKEKIIYIVHKHFFPIWRTFLKKIIIFIAIPLYTIITVDLTIIQYIAAAFILYGLISMSYVYFKWSSSAYVLTDKNLIYVNWVSFLKQDVVRFHYENIETIETHTSTFAHNIFQFGHLEVKASNSTNNKTLYHAAHIHKAQSAIAELQDLKLQDMKNIEMRSIQHAFQQTLKSLSIKY